MKTIVAAALSSQSQTLTCALLKRKAKVHITKVGVLLFCTSWMFNLQQQKNTLKINLYNNARLSKSNAIELNFNRTKSNSHKKNCTMELNRTFDFRTLDFCKTGFKNQQQVLGGSSYLRKKFILCFIYYLSFLSWHWDVPSWCPIYWGLCTFFSPSHCQLSSIWKNNLYC